MAKPEAAVPMTKEEERKSRRARFDPANLPDERKIELARRLAVYWVAEGMQDPAYARFADEMVKDYEWTPEEVKTFLFTQSQRLVKTWRTLGDWQDGYGEITFND